MDYLNSDTLGITTSPMKETCASSDQNSSCNLFSSEDVGGALVFHFEILIGGIWFRNLDTLHMILYNLVFHCISEPSQSTTEDKKKIKLL
jgi:hypothetical protein